jgi:ATP-binding cassette, subfamily B, bacterial PglK
MLTREQMRKYILLQLLFGVTALIQVAGIASLAPFIALLANQKLIHEHPLLNRLYNELAFTSDIAFFVFLAFVIMAFIVFSNVVSALTMWFSTVFSQNLGSELQSTVYRSYLYKDHVFFSRTNSSHMISMITDEAPRFTYMVLQPLLNLISQLFIVLVIACGLLYIDPLPAFISLAVIGGVYVLTFRTIKARLYEYGQRHYRANTKKFRLLNESIGGFKEVKLLGTEEQYEHDLRDANITNARASSAIALLGDLPRFMIETIAFCAMLGLAIYLLATRGNSANIISILSLYAMAAYKLLPAAQSIFKAAAQIKGNRSALDVLYPEVIEGRTVVPDSNTTPIESADINADIRFRDVSYSYPGTATPAIKNADLVIKRNTLTAFAGASGAGKSTMADLLLGFLLPTDGTMWVGNTQITQDNKRSWQKRLGYVPQNIFLIDDSVSANIAFGVNAADVDHGKVKAAAKLANIDQFIESLPEQYDFNVGERGAKLSGGQKQRLGIARALYHDADILVLDEATSALDNISERDVMSTILGLKATKTIVMIAHRLSTIERADMIAVFNAGDLEDSGTFKELYERNLQFRTMVHPHEKATPL